NLDRQRLVALDPSGAAAGRAGLGNDLARAVTLGAGLLEREESLRNADLALPVAGRAGLRLRAGFRPRAVTGFAGLHRRDADLRFGAARGLLERELEVVAQIGAAVHAAAACPSARAGAEDLAEDVAAGGGEPAEAIGPRAEPARTCGTEAGRRVHAGVAELVVRRALACVGEHFVGFLRLLEFLFGALVRVPVRVVPHRELAIRLLDVLLRGIAIDAEHRIVVALRHSIPAESLRHRYDKRPG